MEASHHILKVFYCYAREDKAFREELETHLFGLRRQQLITTWSDREIDPGMEWAKEIDTHLNTSHLILLLVSPNFLASDYCYGIEMKRALERHKAGEAHVVPIIIRPVYWEGTPFRKLQALPTGAKPISLWSNRDNAWLDVVKGIREVINRLQVSLKEKENQLKRDLVDEGEKLLDQGRYEEALTKFDKAIVLDGKDSRAIASRGEVYRLMEQYEKALTDFDRAIALDDKYAWAIANRGETYREMGRYEDALADLDRSVALGNEGSWTFAGRGVTYRLMERYEDALADLDRAIALDDKYAWAIANRGMTYELMERYEEALADFNRAIALDDEYSWAIANRGETYREMERYEEALADFNRAIALDDEYSWAITRRGETYREMGRYEEALADFNRAIALDDKRSWAIASRGETYKQMKRHEEALADFNQAIALDDKYDWAIANRGETYRHIGRYEEALADFDRAIALDKDNEWYWYNRALTNLLTSNMYNFFLDIKSALKLAQTQLRQEPDNYIIAFNTACIRLVSGQFHDAEARYANLITNCPSRYSLQEAANDLAEFLEIQPKHELARKIHDQLQKRIDELK